MAWFAELKRRKWYCIQGINMIQVYRKYLYDTWYDSLTREQKQKLEEYRQRQRERDEGEFYYRLMQLATIAGVCTGLHQSTRDKYHGVYDWF